MVVLIIAEKPDQAKKYVDAISSKKQKKEGYYSIESDIFPGEVIVTYAIGHLVVLSDPAEYDVKYKTWSLDNLPFLPQKYMRKANSKTYSQYCVLEKLLKSLNNSDEIVIATDPDRAGEAIAWNLIKKFNIQKPNIKRLWANSTEKKALIKAFSNLRDANETYRYYIEEDTRAISDYLVGMNLTQLVTLTMQSNGLNNELFNIGRVQTPTLFMVYQRENEINNFKSEAFYDLTGIQTYDDKEYIFKTDQRFKSKEETIEFLKKYGFNKKEQGSVTDVEIEEKNTSAPKLFKLGGLQKYANKEWDYSLDKTLSIVQKLYNDGYLSYPRTDSSLITTNEFEYLKEHVQEYKKLLNEDIQITFTEPRKKYVNNNKVLEHYAIIPTTNVPDNETLKKFTQEEQNIYLTVLKQTLSMFMDDYRYKQTKVIVNIKGISFELVGNEIINNGWKDLIKSNNSDTVIPKYEKGDNVELLIHAKEGFTKPPKELTEGSLGGEGGLMEKCGKLVDDESLKEGLSTGIGTPATRGNIVKNLISNGYLALDGKILKTTKKGKLLCQSIEGTLISKPDMTADWEMKLKDISENKMTQEKFLKAVEKYVNLEVQNIPEKINKNIPKETVQSLRADQVVGKCPKCQSEVIDMKKVCKCVNTECDFIIFKTMAQKKLSQSVIKELLKDGNTTKQINGFKSKKGKTFSAKLEIDNNYKVAFNFDK